MEPDQWQLGRTKVFIKNPESLFLLEEQRERKFDQFARRIQIFYRRWKAQQYYEELKVKASDIMMHKKERRPGTINRNFVGDYIGFGDNPSLRSLVGKKAVRCCATRLIHARYHHCMGHGMRQRVLPQPHGGFTREGLQRDGCHPGWQCMMSYSGWGYAT